MSKYIRHSSIYEKTNWEWAYLYRHESGTKWFAMAKLPGKDSLYYTTDYSTDNDAINAFLDRNFAWGSSELEIH